MTAHLLTASLMALTVATTAAEETCDLRLRLRPGQSWSFDQSLDVTQTRQFSAEGQPPFQHPGPSAVGKVPAGYTQVAQTDSGRKFVARLPKVQSVWRASGVSP